MYHQGNFPGSNRPGLIEGSGVRALPGRGWPYFPGSNRPGLIEGRWTFTALVAWGW